MFEKQEQEQEQEHVHTHSYEYNNKQEFYFTIGWKGLSVVSTLAYCAPL